MGSNTPSTLSDTDPELAEIRDRLIFGEIANSGTLDDKQRELIAMASLIAGHALASLKIHVIGTLNVGATPVEIKETIYHTAPYAGFPALRRQSP